MCYHMTLLYTSVNDKFHWMKSDRLAFLYITAITKGIDQITLNDSPI